MIYSVFPTSVDGNCAGAAQTIAVIVKPPLALLNEDTVTICSGNPVNLNLIANTAVTFNWYANQNVSVLGESISVVSSDIISDVLTNNSSSVQEVNYSVIGTSTINGCSSPVFDLVVFVNPTPTVTPTADVTYCNGVNTQPILFTGGIPGTTFDWTNNNSAIGMTTSGTNSIPSFTATNNGIDKPTANLSASAIEACALILNKYEGSGLDTAQRVFRIAIALNTVIMEMKSLDSQIAKLQETKTDSASN